VSSPAPTPGPPRPAPAWREIGRAAPGNAHWATWVAPVGDGGALYRSLFVADGSATVSVELQPARGAGAARGLHRGRCDLPTDGAGAADGRVEALLAAADDAVARTASAGDRDGAGGP
jgi:hypothetical protein